MNETAVKRLGLILSIQAEIEGMKADNLHREQNGLSPAWGIEAFDCKAEEIKDIVYKHEDQL